MMVLMAISVMSLRCSESESALFSGAGEPAWTLRIYCGAAQDDFKRDHHDRLLRILGPVSEGRPELNYSVEFCSD
jgi:hypothetical protein